MMSPRSRISFFCVGLVSLVACGAIGTAAVGEEDSAAMMAAIMTAAKVGEPHDLLRMMAGNWTTQNRSWQEPEGTPLESAGTSDQKLIFGGRFLQSDYKGNFMGIPFEGMGLLGYDNLKQQYVSVWIDNMSTAILYSSGQYDPAAKTLTMFGESIDPVTGQNVPARTITTMVGDNEHYFAYFAPGPEGEEVKWMEIVYVRQ